MVGAGGLASGAGGGAKAPPVPPQAERLACQKKLLLNQVLKLEWKLEEAGEVAAQHASQLQAAVEEAGAATGRVKELEVRLAPVSQRLPIVKGHVFAQRQYPNQSGPPLGSEARNSD